MGGTSTDVSRFDGRLELETETVKANLSVYAPTLAIETVAAGGGSVCWYESGMLRVVRRVRAQIQAPLATAVGAHSQSQISMFGLAALLVISFRLIWI